MDHAQGTPEYVHTAGCPSPGEEVREGARGQVPHSQHSRRKQPPPAEKMEPSSQPSRQPGSLHHDRLLSPLLLPSRPLPLLTVRRRWNSIAREGSRFQRKKRPGACGRIGVSNARLWVTMQGDAAPGSHVSHDLGWRDWRFGWRKTKTPKSDLGYQEQGSTGCTGNYYGNC